MDAIKITKEFLESAKTALEMAETEMRYAGWAEDNVENVGRKPAYESVCKALQIANTGITTE